jgi:putative nucleotidyltransferase with HDIG domain
MASKPFKSLERTKFEEMVNMARVLETVLVTAIVSTGIISLILLMRTPGTSAFTVFGLFLTIIFLYWLYKQGFYRIAGSGLLIAISVVISYNFYIGGGIHDNAIVVFPVLITVGGMVLGKRFIPYLTGLFLLEVSLIFWMTTKGIITPFDGAISIYFHSFITVFIILMICGIVIWITMDTLERNFLKIIDSESDLRDSYNQAIDGWGRALELFDRETEGHSKRVMDLTIEMAEIVGIKGSEIEDIRRGALLHDIGKMGIDEELLNKPESLSQAERLEVEKHPLHAHKLLKDIPFLDRAMDIPLYHHERWDGTGYPFKLSGEEIPLSARIFALVDNWDALLSDRPYRKAWPRDKVVTYIQNESGKKFDPNLVERFIDLIE